MTRFRITPVPPEFADRHRALPGLEAVVADRCPGFPCRICLQDAKPGETLFLVPFSPFGGPAPHRSEGPIYVHAESCTPYTAPEEVPGSLRSRLLALRAYDASGRMVGAEVVDGESLEAHAERLLEYPGTDHLHVHFAKPGCYACRLDRA